jgi:hypothetical protein
LSPTTTGSYTPRRRRPSRIEGEADFGCYAADFTQFRYPEDAENDLSNNGNPSLLASLDAHIEKLHVLKQPFYQA